MAKCRHYGFDGSAITVAPDGMLRCEVCEEAFVESSKLDYAQKRWEYYQERCREAERRSAAERHVRECYERSLAEIRVALGLDEHDFHEVVVARAGKFAANLDLAVSALRTIEDGIPGAALLATETLQAIEVPTNPNETGSGLGDGGETLEVPHVIRQRCEWREVAEPDETTWESACGGKWVFMAGGPHQNGIRFCQNCGKPVEVAPDNQHPKHTRCKGTTDGAHEWERWENEATGETGMICKVCGDGYPTLGI